MIANINDSETLKGLLEDALKGVVSAYRKSLAEGTDLTPRERFELHSAFIVTLERWNALRYGLEQDLARKGDAHGH